MPVPPNPTPVAQVPGRAWGDKDPWETVPEEPRLPLRWFSVVKPGAPGDLAKSEVSSIRALSIGVNSQDGDS